MNKVLLYIFFLTTMQVIASEEIESDYLPDIADYRMDFGYVHANPIGKEKLDSLKYSEQKQTGINKIKAKLEIGRLETHYSIDSAIQYAETSYKLAASLKQKNLAEKAMQDMCLYYIIKGNYVKAHKLADLLIERTKASSNYLSKANALLLKSFAFLNNEEYYKTFNYLFNSLEIFEKNKDTTGIALMHFNLARSYYRTGFINLAEKQLKTSLQIFRKQKNHTMIALINEWFSYIEEQKSNFNLSLHYLQKSLYQRKEAENISGILFAYRSIGTLYLNKKRIDSAKVYYQKAIELAKEFDMNYHLGNLYTLMAFICNLEDKNKEQIEFNTLALECRKIYGIEHLIASSYINLGSDYFNAGNTKLAIQFCQKGMILAESLNILNQRVRSYGLLMKYYESENDFKGSLIYSKKLLQFKDSMNYISNKRNMLKLQYDHDLKSKEEQEKLLLQKNQIQSLEIERKDLLAVVLVIGLALLLITAIFFINKNRLKNKTNRILKENNQKLKESEVKLTELNASKDKFFSVIAHDLMNPLHYFRLSFRMLNDSIDSYSKKDRDNLINDMRASVENLYNLLENLLLWSKVQTGTLEYSIKALKLNFILNDVLDSLSKQIENKEIEVVNRDNNHTVLADSSIMHIVMRNLVANAIKFSYPGNQIIIESHSDKDFVEFSVTDFGSGIADSEIDKLFKIDTLFNQTGTNNETGTGIGLILCKELIELCGGSIWYVDDYTKGTKFSVMIPMAQ